MKNIKRLFTASLFLAAALILTSSQTKEYKASMPGWLVNLEDAEKISRETGKPILATFTGSDWCGWCIRLKNEVFTTKEFKAWAKENVVLLEVDFPKRFKLPNEIAAQNAGMQRAFKVGGYPTIWVFDSYVDETTGRRGINALAKSGYLQGGPSIWTADIEKKVAFAKEQLKNK